ncbi:MAG TPA: methyltransferase domain-containing protein [Gammaproteobacteria bacterium]
MKSNRLSSAQWSQLWRRDSITTFARQFNSNYDGEFAAFWDARFDPVPNGAVVVDLATGNGAIALLAIQHARSRGKLFRVGGLDYADIDPTRVLAGHEDLSPLLAAIEFASGVRIEDTTLGDASVDLLTSQYGFEYAERDAAAAEAWRVLKAGGRMALVLHHAESAVVELAREGLSQVQLCLQQEELDKRVAALVKIIGEAKTRTERRTLKSNPKAERLRQKLNASLARITQRAERYRDPEGFIGIMVPNYLKVFGEYKEASMAQKLKYLREVRASFDAFRERMADLAGAALTQSDFDALIGLLETKGFDVVERGLMRYKGDLMGWTLVVSKPAS